MAAVSILLYPRKTGPSKTWSEVPGTIRIRYEFVAKTLRQLYDRQIAAKS